MLCFANSQFGILEFRLSLLSCYIKAKLRLVSCKWWESVCVCVYLCIHVCVCVCLCLWVWTFQVPVVLYIQTCCFTWGLCVRNVRRHQAWSVSIQRYHVALVVEWLDYWSSILHCSVPHLARLVNQVHFRDNLRSECTCCRGRKEFEGHVHRIRNFVLVTFSVMVNVERNGSSCENYSQSKYVLLFKFVSATLWKSMNYITLGNLTPNVISLPLINPIFFRKKHIFVTTLKKICYCNMI